MNIINLTPHEINIINTIALYVERVNVPASGQLARVAETREKLPSVDGIQVTRPAYGAVEGLPAPQEGVIYVVSAMVLAQCAGRTDVFAPGPAVRDEAGKIIGCEGLSAAPVSEGIGGFMDSLKNAVVNNRRSELSETENLHDLVFQAYYNYIK